MASGHLGNGVEDPRDVSGGRRLSDSADAVGVRSSSTSRELGEGNTNRHLRLLTTPSVSVVSYGELRELAKAQIRRECRRFEFDWEAYVADGPEWVIVEVVHRRAVQQGRDRGLDLRPTDIPTDTVLMAVRDVIAEWTGEPELRPSYDDFCFEQARRGDLGRQTQQAQSSLREAQVFELVASGISNNAEIARRLGVHRSTVGRIRGKANETPLGEPQVEALTIAEPALFPAPEIPRWERWPVNQFMMQTSVVLEADDACWLADVGRCYEAEGRVDDLMHAIRASAGSDVRDPWAYLQRCVANRGDASTVSPQLVADVLVWAGEDSLRYALTAISGGYVRRPRAYLERTLQYAAAAGERAPGRVERPVAMAVAMCRKWAPELSVDGAAAAVEGEEAASRTGYISRRPAAVAVADVPHCCVGLNGVTGDELGLNISTLRDQESSRSKADATPVEPDVGTPGVDLPSAPEETEQGSKPADSADSDGIRRPQSHGEALKQSDTTVGPLPRGIRTGILEHGPCRHPLAALLATAMDLEAVFEVECTSGCGHQLYSDRGPVECPCHLAAAKAGQVARALQERQRVRAGTTERPWDVLEVELFHLRLQGLPWAARRRNSAIWRCLSAVASCSPFWRY